jgi:hypothetical protein
VWDQIEGVTDSYPQVIADEDRFDNLNGRADAVGTKDQGEDDEVADKGDDAIMPKYIRGSQFHREMDRTRKI